MTKTSKANIDILVPMALTAALAYYLYFKKNTKTQELAVICIVTFIVLYMITSKITKGIKAQTDGAVTSIVQAAPISEYNPAPIADALYQDIYEVAGFRNTDIYHQLVSLPDSHLVSTCQYWNDNYRSKDNETLRQAIDDEKFWLYPELDTIRETLNKRFDNLKIN